MSIQFLKMSRPAAPSFAAAQLITTEVVRCGYLPAKTIAIIPPIEVPWTCALLDPERVHQAREVVRPDLHVVVLDRPIRCPVAAHVVVDDAEVLRELGRGRVEVVVPEPGAVDLHDRLALAGDPVPEVDPVDLDRARPSILPALRRTRPRRDYRTMSDIRRPARAEVVGSLLRPPQLRAAVDELYGPGHSALLADERPKDRSRSRRWRTRRFARR